MSTIRHSPTIHAKELRALVVAAIPELREELAIEEESDPHRVMRALFRVASQATQDGDITTVVRCFRLSNQLIHLEKDSDIFVTSAIWTSFANRFNRNDPLALKIFHSLEPQVREAIHSPFTLPHTWLREVKIVLPGAERWMKWLTISRQVEAESRFVRLTSSVGHFAVVRLQLEPMLDERSVMFRNRLDEAEEVPLGYIHDVIEGITRALIEKCGEKHGVSYLRVDLIGLRHHIVDSSSADFVKTGKESIEQFFGSRAHRN